MAVTFAVFAVYGLFAASLRDRVISRPAVMAWLRGSFAAAFAALGPGWRLPSDDEWLRPKSNGGLEARRFATQYHPGCPGRA